MHTRWHFGRRGGEEGGHRRRREGVGIRQPHVQREQGHLEADADGEEAESGELLETLACGTAAVVPTVGTVASPSGEFTIGTGGAFSTLRTGQTGCTVGTGSIGYRIGTRT